LSKISFLTNDDIWATIPEIIKTSKHTDVAVAFLGTDGSKLLPLKKGDRLVVDMSEANVKAGSTNPFEIEKLIKRGVKAFTRPNLHAKIVITNKSVLVGSANVSKNSRDNLDEAAIITNDPVTIQRARDFFKIICDGEILLKSEYLEECKKIYKPSRISGNRKSQSLKKGQRVSHAKLRIVSLVVVNIPKAEKAKYEKSEEKAEKQINSDVSILESFMHRSKMVDELEIGDWIIQCIRQEDKRILVFPPSRYIGFDSYIRNEETGKERFIFYLERPKGSQIMSWANFRKEFNSTSPKKLKKPPTMAIRDVGQADDLLRLWTPKGRIARKN
jgi:hypothetical protein